MLNISKKTTYSFIFFVLFFNITLRALPIHNHGGDTWVMINRITVINEMGYFSWYHNLTSFLGWHLYSYPSGYATFIAAFSQVTGLSPIYHDYLFSIFISSFSVILMFVFSKEMLGKNHLALLSMFIFNTFFIYVLYTWDNLASRGVFILFSPVILLTIKLIDRNNVFFVKPFFYKFFVQIIF